MSQDNHHQTDDAFAFEGWPLAHEVAADISGLDEDDLRRIATTVRARLANIVALSDLATVDDFLAAALALPPGKEAKRMLRNALEEVGIWFRQSSYTAWEVMRDKDTADTNPPSKVPSCPICGFENCPTGYHDNLSDDIDCGFSSFSPPGWNQAPSAKRRERYLLAEAPDQVRPGDLFSVLVKVDAVVPPGWVGSPLDVDVPPEGVTLTVVVSAYGLVADGSLTQRVHVPAEGASDVIQFGFRVKEHGRYKVLVRAFLGGTSVGEVRKEVAVTEDFRAGAASVRPAQLGPLRSEMGEVTLVVDEVTKGRYRIQLVGEQECPIAESEMLTGDPQRQVANLEQELNRLAFGTSEHYGEARLVRLRNLGIDLWRAAVPEAIRARFLDERDRITSVSIQSDSDNVPWELVYPFDGKHDEGFLVERFPVLRRASGQSWRCTISLEAAAFVAASSSPSNAQDEVAKIRTLLGDGVSNKDVTEYVELVNLLETTDSVPNLLHFSCHNMYADEMGSRIELQGGPFQPNDLAPAAAAKSLAKRSPLVFLNACRSAKPHLSWARPVSWASNFMEAGAAIFIGSLWNIRSSAAEKFADAFYHAFVTQGLALGEAAKVARVEVKAGAQDGDPTWLAYTVYGHPSARIRQVGADV